MSIQTFSGYVTTCIWYAATDVQRLFQGFERRRELIWYHHFYENVYVTSTFVRGDL